MSDLTRREKLKLERFFVMEGGYLLDFSNSTLSNFVFETVNLDFYSDKYQDYGDSKANRMRALWSKENNFIVGTLILEILEYWREKRILNYTEISQPEQSLFDECQKIGIKLKQDTIVEEIDVIKEIENDKDFNFLAKSIKESIEKNEPEVALDRLHTYVMKHLRQLCENHKIKFNKEESLNAIYGKYIKILISTDKIESKMSENILKYSINILESFNDIRNNKSLAHDNSVLNYNESILIFNNVTNSLKFIESVELKIEQDNKPEIVDWENWSI